MDNFDYFQGALGEVNSLIVNLQKHKDHMLRSESSFNVTEDFDLASSSYVGYLKMLSTRRDPIENPRVVYQGEPGAYSEAACRNFFGKNVNAKGLTHFEDTFLALKNGEADYAVLPIENSSTGAIRQVYDLLETYNYFFVGETSVHINHALMALPGTKIEDITTVYSHEQGLFQCEKFLAQHPEWETLPQADTAGSAKMVAQIGDPHIAAICSPLAADIYHLDILLENVNHNSNNTTRFVVVSPCVEKREDRDKMCISITTGHKTGALLDVLTVFAVNDVNLLRLESRPIPEHNWEYMFFIEFSGDLFTKEMDTILHELSLFSENMRILGNFKTNI